MFVTASDFNIPPYSIANIEGNNSFPDYVASAEEDILKSLLGKPLYDAFVGGLDTDYPEERWVNLRDGSEYEFKENPYDWKGMRDLLVPYIYQSWLTDTFDSDTGIGIASAKPENSKRLNPARRIASAYNVFVDKAGCFRHSQHTLYGYLAWAGGQSQFDDVTDDITSYLSKYFRLPQSSKNTFGI